MIYSGTFDRAIDKKRRVQLPSSWSAGELANQRLTVLAYPVDAPKFLAVFPQAVMEELVTKVKATSYSDPKARGMRRVLGGKSESLTLDGEGRLMIPDEMLKPTKLDEADGATVVGCLDRFEIWNQKEFSSITSEDGKLFAEAMGLT